MTPTPAETVALAGASVRRGLAPTPAELLLALLEYETPGKKSVSEGPA